MTAMRKKADLPTRTCVHCQHPFTWRKKWEKVWDEVLYCSDRCRGEAKRARHDGARHDAPRPEETAR